MAECTDKRIRSMLHHYELGLLSEKDRSEVEKHLMECDDCFEEVKDFLPQALLLRHDSEFRDIVTRASRKTTRDTGKAMGWLRSPIPALSLVAVCILTIVVFVAQPWDFITRRDEEAIAADNRIAVMYFANAVHPDDPGRLGEMITNLLITDLAESRFVQVVSAQRLSDMHTLLDRDNGSDLGLTRDQRIAAGTGSRWILKGRIDQIQPQIIVTSEILDAATGNRLALQHLTGYQGQNIFSVVDSLTHRIKRELPLPDEALQETDRVVADVTTHSIDAYRFYLEGIEYTGRIFIPEAIASFEQALALDSTFAMAYYYLARLKDPKLITLAVRYADHATRKEQLYIRSCAAAYEYDFALAIDLLKELMRRYPQEKDACCWLGRYNFDIGNFEAAVPYLHMAIDIDPLYKPAYNLLALALSEQNEFTRAIETVDRYIAIAPDEPNPYDTKGGIFLKAGMLDSAVASFRTALNVKPDFHYALMQLGHVYAFKIDFVRADSCYTALSGISNEEISSQADYYRALLLIRCGKLDQALNLVETAFTDGGSTRYPEMSAILLLMKTRILWAKMETDPTTRAFHDVFEDYRTYFPPDSCRYYSLYAHFLAEIGDFDSAERITSQLAECGNTPSDTSSQYWYARGVIEFYRGNAEEAAVQFEKTPPRFVQLPLQYMLGRAYLESGEYEKAERIFKRVHESFSPLRLFFSIWDVEIYYYLGQCNEGMGNDARALENYTVFRDIRKDADAELISRFDVDERINRLIDRRHP